MSNESVSNRTTFDWTDGSWDVYATIGRPVDGRRRMERWLRILENNLLPWDQELLTKRSTRQPTIRRTQKALMRKMKNLRWLSKLFLLPILVSMIIVMNFWTVTALLTKELALAGWLAWMEPPQSRRMDTEEPGEEV
eukprot:scaffold98656_cov31-Cyclotella_meneghiniana.AAC.1